MLEFDFDKEIILEDDIVLLRPLKLSDVDYLIEISEEPDLWTYSFVKGNGKENLIKYVWAALNNRDNKIEYPFVVYDKRKKEYAGSTRFCEINTVLQATRLGYTWYGKKFQGTGLNKHCKYLLFEFAFEKVGFERIGMGAYADNFRSIAAMESVGCKIEGKLRGMFPSPNNNRRTDSILLSILKDEWIEKEKEKLQRKLS